jgi:hypothetical protein
VIIIVERDDQEETSKIEVAKDDSSAQSVWPMRSRWPRAAGPIVTNVGRYDPATCRLNSAETFASW